MSRDGYFPSKDINDLLKIMKLLRSSKGCPWDREQTNESLIPYTLEEAYEVADAVASGIRNKICEELGDLLLQIVFHCQIAQERGDFEFADVVHSITRKLIRRHPHIFADEKANTPEDVNQLWQAAKAGENGGENKGVPPLPGLLLIEKISNRVPLGSIEDPIMRDLLSLVEQAKRENRCLEADSIGFCAKFWL